MADTGTTLQALLDETRNRFVRSRSVLSFDEYVDLFRANPQRQGRDAARYLCDMFDHYGTEKLDRPVGADVRWKLFDLPWEDAEGRRDALIGHEALQREVYRALSNFVRQGRIERLVLLHGPNGSAKSTFVSSILRALEHYSSLEEGALYTFYWVFPRGRSGEARIGFGGRSTEDPRPGESFAHLDEHQLDAKISSEVRDHPLLVLPVDVRRALIRSVGGDETTVPRMLWRGGLSHKCQQIFEALLGAYRGDLGKVLSHVQVERWYISRRYRCGACTIGPQMAVDASERQVTASRSLAALPPSLQNVTLFEPYGELVDAAGGLLEFADLLKRPLDAWKYLLIMIETGEIPLVTSNLVPNVVLMGSSNEVHLDAFREHPEYPSFRGRLELVRAPYLLDWLLEKKIYDNQILPGIEKHVAPHASELAALFAVLTRLRKPGSERYARPLSAIVGDLSPVEKAELYARGLVPQRLSNEHSKELHAAVEQIAREYDNQPVYEGRTGASPREIRALLLDAAQSRTYTYLSPVAVLEEIARLCLRKNEFEWLRQEPVAGGYHDPRYFQKVLRERLLDHLEAEMRDASGIVDESRYLESFDRYISHVTAWIKTEKIRNRITGRDEDPSETLMRETEHTLGSVGQAADFRRNLISAVAAQAIDHPGERIDHNTLFPQYLQKLKDAFFAERRKQVISMTRELLVLLADEGTGLDAEQKTRATTMLERLKTRFHYIEASARDAAALLLKERFLEEKSGRN